MEQLMTLTCTHCGKTIQIPQGLETFSCLYCGEKMSLADFAPREAQIADEEDRAYAEEHFIDVVASYPDYFRNFGRRTYTDSFFAYKEGIEPIFQAMNRYVCAKPDQAFFPGIADFCTFQLPDPVFDKEKMDWFCFEERPFLYSISFLKKTYPMLH